MSHTKVVTGCLQKGDEPGEFSITGKDGRTWGLRSNSVKLEQHVGHQVTVTGSAHRESKAQEKAEEKKEGQMENAAGKEKYGHLRITSLKMISETCQQIKDSISCPLGQHSKCWLFSFGLRLSELTSRPA